MKLWSSWYPDLAPHVPGCPNILMDHELRRSAQAFFEGTKAWIIDRAAPIPVLAGQAEVPNVTGDPELDLIEVRAAYYDGKRMDPVVSETLDARFSDDWSLHQGTPEHFMELQAGVLRIYPRPLADALTGIKLRMVVAPSDTATGLPDEIANRYQDAIHLGARARLMLMVGKPWSNERMGSAYATAFASLLDTAHAKAARGNVRARMRTRTKWC